MSKTNDDRYNAIRSVPPRSSGPIVVKAVCNEEIRRIPILNQELTYEELCFMMHRLFRDRLSSDVQNMILKYTDQDGDLITMTDSLDISHALEHSNVLRVTVFDKEVLPVNSFQITKEGGHTKLTPQKAKHLKQSLLELQEQINYLIKTYCQEDYREEAPKPKNQIQVVKETKPTLSTQDLAELLESSAKTSNIGSGIDFSKPKQPFEQSSFDMGARKQVPYSSPQQTPHHIPQHSPPSQPMQLPQQQIPQQQPHIPQKTQMPPNQPMQLPQQPQQQQPPYQAYPQAPLQQNQFQQQFSPQQQPQPQQQQFYPQQQQQPHMQAGGFPQQFNNGVPSNMYQ